MTRFDIGGGDGVRIVRPVIIFQDEKKFNDFNRGVWSAGAEAAAKVGESGAAGGAGSAGSDKGYSIHMITDAGVSATVTVDVIRVSPIKLKE